MASSQIETVSTGADKAKLGAAAGLILAALVAFYLLGSKGAIAQWAALLLGLVLQCLSFSHQNLVKA